MSSIEIWRTCKLTGSYEISNLGRVRNLKGRILKGGIKKRKKGSKPYLTVDKKIGGVYKKISIHRMIAATFLGDISGLVVNHLNGDTTDNSVNNLEITTVLGNCRHAISTGLISTNPKPQKLKNSRASKSKQGGKNPRAKLTEEQAREIKYDLTHLSSPVVADRFGISAKSVSNIWRKERWSYV